MGSTTLSVGQRAATSSRRAASRDAANERIRAVHGELSSIAQKLGVVRDVHDVRVRETPDGEIVNFHAMSIRS
jgi:hypothetical protein